MEPDHGTVFDPACGSGGMFVQSSHFIEHAGRDTARKVVFYGQEKNRDTVRIARMNLAVHGLEGKIAEDITYYQDEHGLAVVYPGAFALYLCNPSQTLYLFRPSQNAVNMLNLIGESKHTALLRGYQVITGKVSH